MPWSNLASIWICKCPKSGRKAKLTWPPKLLVKETYEQVNLSWSRNKTHLMMFLRLNWYRILRPILVLTLRLKLLNGQVKWWRYKLILTIQVRCLLENTEICWSLSFLNLSCSGRRSLEWSYWIATMIFMLSAIRCFRKVMMLKPFRSKLILKSIHSTLLFWFRSLLRSFWRN